MPSAEEHVPRPFWDRRNHQYNCSEYAPVLIPRFKFNVALRPHAETVRTIRDGEGTGRGRGGGGGGGGGAGWPPRL